MFDTVKFLHEPYFDSRISFHKPLSGTPISISIFPLLKFSIRLTLNPPSCSGLQMFFQLIQTILQPQPHSLVIFSQMNIGALKKEMQVTYVSLNR